MLGLKFWDKNRVSCRSRIQEKCFETFSCWRSKVYRSVNAPSEQTRTKKFCFWTEGDATNFVVETFVVYEGSANVR